MKRFLSRLFSIILSFLVLLNSVPFFVFAESTGNVDIGSGSIVVGDTEIPDQEQDTGSMITDSGQEIGQSGQVIDSIFSTGDDSQNTGFNSDYLNEQGQTGQDSSIPQNSTPSRENSTVPSAPTRAPTINPELIISEIFFDGNNEWIEIYNLSSTQFSGDVLISGASTSPKTINNLVIGGLESKIFTDTSVDSIFNTSNVFQTNMGFSILDTQAINIDLIYSGVVLDSVNLDTGTVSALNNTKTSFHRFVDTHNIVASDVMHNINTTTGYIANPGSVYNEATPPTDPILKITEVYFDGDDERFEISNLDTLHDFSGNISIAGDLNLNISTQISAGESMVYANALYSMFQTGQNIQTISILSGGIGDISFDTGAINLDLIRSGQVLDTFYAHETQVQYYTNADTSFEKVGGPNLSDLWTTTVVGLASDRYYNTNWGIAANPTRYYTTGENLIDVTQERQQASYSGLSLPIDCDDFRDDYTVNISEVYYGNNIYSPYVELRVQENIFDTYSYIKLEGTALSGVVAFATESSAYSNIDMERNKRILISNSESRYNEGRESVSDPNFALTDTGGRLTLYGRDDRGGPTGDGGWEILDIIYLNGQNIQTAGNSLYVGGDTNQCASIFDYQDKFSPGLTIGQSQFIDITPDPVIQYISVGGGGGGCSTQNKSTFNTDDNLEGTIKISAMKHFGNLQILKLQNKTNQDIDLRDYKLQSLDGSMQTIKGNTLFAHKTMSFVGNYDFPTRQDYCINLLKSKNTSDNKIHSIDRYCRNSMSKASSLDEQKILDQLSFWVESSDVDDDALIESDPTNSIDVDNPMQTNTVKIIDLDYNPAGSDRDNESITLLLMTGGQQDLSDYILQYIKDGKITNKTNLKGILTQGGQQIFKGDFTLPNSTKDKLPVTVNLIKKNQYNNQNYIVDTYIYNPNKITEIPDGNYKVISVIDGDTIKISYAGQNFNIRFAGIDAPESSTLRCGKVECFGPEAKIYLKSLLENQTIKFESSLSDQQGSSSSSQDSFDRFVGYIYLSGENINQNMIKNGYAREFSYKNKDYKYSTEFKLAQDYAKSHKLGLWGNDQVGCNGQRLCPVIETQQDDLQTIPKDQNYILNIQNIIYNPKGPDKDHEIIKIKNLGAYDINLENNFYLMVNDKRKSLKKYGNIGAGKTKALQGTFAFPNTKKTTVSLFYDSQNLDSYVYDPAIDKLIKDELESELDSKLDSGSTLTGVIQNTEISQLGYTISIVSTLPNPLGKDTLGEEIGLLASQEINLASGYYLKIGDTKKYFKTKNKDKIKNNNYQLLSNQETLLVGNFGLPNKAGCVEIGYENFIFDKFCYSEPEEGQKFMKSNGVLESINVIDFGILNKAKLQNIGNQVCLMFGSQKFACKNMPYSKLSIKKVNQNKLYKEFFDSFENYLKDQRKIMYYDTDIKNYFNLLNEIEKAISEGKSEFEINGIKFKTSDFKSAYKTKYPKTTSEFIAKKLSDFVPSKIKQKYNTLLQEYNEYLMN